MSRVLKGSAASATQKVHNFAGQSATREPPPEPTTPPETEPEAAPARADMAEKPAFAGLAKDAAQPTATPRARASAKAPQPVLTQSYADDTALKAAKARLAKLEAEGEKQARQLEELTARSETLQAEAFEKGRLEGLHKSDESAGKRLAMLEQALRTVSEKQVQSLAQTEIVALQIAKAALARMVGDPDQRQGLLTQLIHHQIEHFARSKPSILRVSPEDFLDAADFSEITARWPDLRVLREKGLKAGECQLALELGEVEIGLPGQVARMAAFFDQLTEEQMRAPATCGEKTV